jgi:hypothetical protein
MDYLLTLISQHNDQFSDEFAEWLPANEHVWKAFVSEAMKIRARGRTHYSSYTIVEFLRHNSAVQEVGGEWKINNNHRPYLPRLFDLCYPHMAGMFEYRTVTKPLRNQH